MTSARPREVARVRRRARARPGTAAVQPETSELRERELEGRVVWVDDATSARMGRVRQKGTRPELMVRRLLGELGHRYRLTNRDLEGSPDIANRHKAWAVFVHGCFWHRHGCKATTTPTRNREFWEAKFVRNVERDRRAVAALRELGFNVVVIWECQTKLGDAGVRAELLRCLGRGSERSTRAGDAL